MRIIQQQTLNKSRDIAPVRDSLAQKRQHRLKVQQLNRISSMQRCGEAGQNQLEAEWITVTGNLPLIEFKLVQRCLDVLLINAVLTN